MQYFVNHKTDFKLDSVLNGHKCNEYNITRDMPTCMGLC